MPRLDREGMRSELSVIREQLQSLRRRAERARIALQWTDEFKAALEASRRGRSDEAAASVAMVWCGAFEDVERSCERLADDLGRDIERS